MNINKVVLVGRVANEPVFTLDKADTKKNRLLVTLAINRINSETADFVTCTLWGKRADAGLKHIGKGKELGIEGRISARWDKVAEKQYFSVNVDNVQYGQDSNKNHGVTKTTTANDKLADKLFANANAAKDVIDLPGLKTSLKIKGYSSAEADEIIASYVVEVAAAAPKADTTTIPTQDTPKVSDQAAVAGVSDDDIPF